MLAGSGKAAASSNLVPAVEAAVKAGVAVDRTPRSSLGIITRNMEFDDDKYGTVSSDTPSPPKARMLLALALTKTRDSKVIQRMFDEY